MAPIGVVVEFGVEAGVPLTPSSSGHALDLGSVECIEAVQEGNVDVDFSGLSVLISRGEPLAERLAAAHLRVDPTSDVIAGKMFPVRPAGAFARPQGIVAGAGKAVLLSQAAVPADGYDDRSAAVYDCGVASAGVEGAVAGHGADLLIGRDPIQQIPKHKAVTLTA